MGANSGIYIHIPFCKSKCIYCDFNSYAGFDSLFADYTKAILSEISYWSSLFKSLPNLVPNQNSSTLYFGGGTPSLIPPQSIGKLIEACRRRLGLSLNAEITLEANPGTVDERKLLNLRSAGVNRLSLGIQSFLDKELRLLRRVHTADEAVRVLEMARHTGFDNLSFDLIFGLPYQTLDEWQQSLTKAIELEPEHISLYALTVEEDTPLAFQIAKGKVPSPDPDLAADMYDLAIASLQKAGYVHYEISNWAKPGHECKHNLIYWHNQPYLGLGAGAHSFLAACRFSNCLRPSEYTDKLLNFEQTGISPYKNADETGLPLAGHPSIEMVEKIQRDTEIAETMFLGLRLLEGVDVDLFAQRFGVRLEKIYKVEIEELEELGLLSNTHGTIALTPKGLLLANEVFVRFMPSDHR